MTDEATQDAADLDPFAQLREQIKTNYSQSRVSDKTLKFLREYVDKIVQAGVDVSSSGISEQDLIESIAVSLDLGVNDPMIFAAIEKQIVDQKVGNHCASSTPSQSNVNKGADPIEMYSGQFLQEATDLVINGAGMDFGFKRTYKSQVVYNGSLGAKWDHVYNLYLRQLGNNLIRSSGELREDLYTLHPMFGQSGFDYWVPPDGRHGIIETYGNSFTWRSPGGGALYLPTRPRRSFVSSH